MSEHAVETIDKIQA
jgi:hypothetical protein